MHRAGYARQTVDGLEKHQHVNVGSKRHVSQGKLFTVLTFLTRLARVKLPV